ncbi:30S ribosomal protein S8e [Candidatus Woesearchaeota archaeon]|nr:30S ribosomal protein S8e [Candidatus Woesearchaeota archaeon]
MVLSQKGRVGRKPTGGLYKQARKKRRFEMGRTPSFTRVSERNKITHIATKGGGLKVRMLEVKTINLFDPKAKKFEKVDTKAVVENPANRHYTRRNIITKGAVLDTPKGKARVTSRPGQDGTVNAVLV